MHQAPSSIPNETILLILIEDLLTEAIANSMNLLLKHGWVIVIIPVGYVSRPNVLIAGVLMLS
jgi:hypothetical protein